MPNWDLLSVYNVQRIMDEIQDIRGLPQPLLFTDRRVPSVSALDGEIMAYYTGRVNVADMIADDQKAVVRSQNPIRLTQTKIPNIKHGEAITQEMMSILERIEAGNAGRRENNIFEDYLVNRIIELREGVLQRKEALIFAMLMDSFNYNRLGIQISNGSWGMPSDLKVTPANPWSNPSTGTPITDLLTVKRIAAQKYGIVLDRTTLSTQALLYASGTTEFRNFANLRNQFVTTVYPVQDTNLMVALMGPLLGMVVEIYDAFVWSEGDDGRQESARYMPENTVIMTTSAADGNAALWDFANGMVIETLPGIIPAMVGGFETELEGPVAYTTSGDPQGNPPGWIMWAVARGFPRRHKLAVSACLNGIY